MKWLIVFLLLCLTAGSAEAATYFLSTTGNNSNNCTAAQNIATPKLTIANLLANCSITAGDVINLRAGVYTEVIDSASLPVGGTSYSNAVTFQGYQNEIATLRPTTSAAVARISGTGTGVSRSYFIFKNLIFDGANATTTGGSDVVALGGGANGIVDHIKFDHVEIIGRGPTTTSGAFNCFHPSTETFFIWMTNGSKIHQCGLATPDGTGGIGHGVYAETESLILEDTEIYDAQGFGIQNYAGSGTNNIYRRLNIHDICLDLGRGCTAFLLQTGTNSVGYNLLIYRSAQQAVGIRGDAHRVLSSTIYNNNTGCASSVNGCNPVVQIDGGVGSFFQNNIVIGNVSNSISTAGSSGTTSDHNVTTGTASAIFTNPAGDDFTLLPGASTVINQGAALCTPPCAYSSDYANIPRPQGAAWDIGAYEFQSAGTAITVAITGSNLGCNLASCTVTSASIILSGTTTATSAGAVTFSTDRGSSGPAAWLVGSGFTTGSIALKAGINHVTVSSTDAAGNLGTAVLTVTYAPTFPGDAMILALGFEDGSGTTATDSSGNSNTGTLVNTPTWVTTGRFGKALLFNGINQFVRVTDANSLRLTQSFTLSAWVQPAASLATFKAVIYKDGGSNESPYSLYGVIGSFGGCTAGGYTGIVTVNGANGPEYSACNSLPLQTGVWTHIAVTYDNATGQLKLYRMGALVQTTAASGYMEPSTVATPLDLRIGGSEFGENWQGLIDEVRVYNKALPITAASNTVAGASCTSVNFADNTAVATASIVGNMNCPIINLSPPSQFKLSAGATELKLGTSATAAKIGANP